MEFNKLKECINKLIFMQEDIVFFLEEEIDEIIEKNIIDDKRVEDIFERLLNLFQTDEVFNLYKKLGRYYYYINKELVIEYCNLYKELYLDEDKILKK